MAEGECILWGIKIRFDMIGAYNSGQIEHPQIVMKNLGIKYKASEPQSIADCWIFYDCENIPNDLPSFLYIIK